MILTALVSTLMVSVCKAQDTGNSPSKVDSRTKSAASTDEEIKKELIKMEVEKVPLLLKGGPAYADYFDRHDSDTVAITVPDGSLQTKAEAVESYRSGKFKVLSMKQFDHQVHVFNGTTAVVTYHGIGTFETDGKAMNVDLIFDDVWVKEDGSWLRIVHNLHNAPKGQTSFHP